jgi:hypothetical protein
MQLQILGSAHDDKYGHFFDWHRQGLKNFLNRPLLQCFEQFLDRPIKLRRINFLGIFEEER